MEQQAALGMARALPAALYCSNDSLSASSRCLPFKAGQVNKVSPSKSINKSLFTHWLIVQVLILILSLSHAPLSVYICLSSSLCMSAACVERQDMIEYNNIEDIQVMSKE